jgi:DNA-binding transcriptional LysR family regulator
MDLKKLRILLAVARTGSFTGAADRIKLTQSAVSQQMALLEQDVREPLFERSRRGVKLTPFALELCERAEPLVAGMENLGAAFRRRTDKAAVVRVGAFPTAGIELLPKAIRLFRASHPDVQVMMSNINLESPEISLETHDVDLILSFDYGLEVKIPHPAIRRIELFEDPFLAILPAHHPLVGNKTIDLIDLAGECWIFHRHPNSYRNVYPLICSRAGFNPEVVFYVDDFQTLQGLIAEEIGVSIAPRLSIIPRREDVAILPIDPPVSRWISALTREKARENDYVDEFVGALEAASKSMSAKDPTGRHAADGMRRPV